MIGCIVWSDGCYAIWGPGGAGTRSGPGRGWAGAGRGGAEADRSRHAPPPEDWIGGGSLSVACRVELSAGGLR